MDRNFAKDIRRFSLISSIAINMVVTIVMGVALGLFLDYMFETKFCVIICSVFFTFAAIINFIKIIIRITKIDEKKNNKK